MSDVLRKCQLFENLDEEHISRIEELAERRELAPGDKLFELGAEAEQVFVVLDGTVELCVPLTIHGAIREVAIASEEAGATLGWSAFVKPYRFRLSARAATAASIASFERAALHRLIDQDSGFGCVILGRIAEIISQRLLTVQALWARELQRKITEDAQMRTRG
ncbi:MAG: cyclic nucleotide-binding domain-containing protein [Acidobacteria bacterium]|nr:cyclic nucleotide-binding domain-containing protein [Acidobacteriota bacterium]NIO60807.1 cyclic nucleotide-binding domain-containing protein [Acidobacteriota bacterium]NIQ31879.1 cyclic nucleotide-binding domain-containing protein [Acidobacteriota bacterium]NIQ87259.1 cyclic nucleotide-binding domain-containing protein [Acidobacteriota bacterium]NIT12475.1 cyclic nucleotide-binding domain-containing protein [Acidobacteriota bacterium]